MNALDEVDLTGEGKQSKIGSDNDRVRIGVSPNVASAPLMPFPSCRDSVRPLAPEICCWDCLQHWSLDPCSRVSSSLGGEIADVIASAYLSAAAGVVQASF